MADSDDFASRIAAAYASDSPTLEFSELADHEHGGTGCVRAAQEAPLTPVQTVAGI